MKLAQAEQAARKAIVIAPRLGAGYVALGSIAAGRFDFGEARVMIRRALTESPNSLRVLKLAASNLIYFGDADEVFTHLAHGLSLDPLDPTFHVVRAQAYYYSRRYNQAIDDARKALSIAPERQAPRLIIGDSLQELGKFAEARAAYQKMPADDLLRIASEAILAARTNGRAGANTRIASLRQMAGEAASYQYGQIFAQLGETDRAFAALDKAVEVKDPGLIGLKKDPVLDPIRPDPRFAALLKRLKFP
jgi:tetratricopeptide (TPR) repeat protein